MQIYGEWRHGPQPCGFAHPRLAVRGFPVYREKGILVVEFSPGVPKDEARRKLWEKNLHHSDKPLDDQCVVCELHFKGHYILRDYVHIVDGKEVSAYNVREAFNLDEDNITLTAMPGLTTSHLEPDGSEKMEVSLASQERRIFRTFNFETEADRDYVDKLFEKFEEHCKLAVNLAYHDFVFGTRDQKLGERFDEWLTELRTLIRNSQEDEKEEDEVEACKERERGFGRLTKDGADATRPDIRRRDQTSRGPTHNPLLTQSGRQPSGGRQDCMRGAVEHPLPLRATDVLGLTQAFGQRPTASSLRPSAQTLEDTWS
ncbi:uncharacterized protein ISCGN_011381 [Ixodes scapularis]